MAALSAVAYCTRDMLRAETTFVGNGTEPIAVSADFAQSWSQEQDQVVILRGRCRLTQGSTTLWASKAVIWRRVEGHPSSPASMVERLSVYLEEDVRREDPGRTLTEHVAYVELQSQAGITWDVTRRATDSPVPQDPLFQRAQRRRGLSRGAVVRTSQHVPASPMPAVVSGMAEGTSPTPPSANPLFARAASGGPAVQRIASSRNTSGLLAADSPQGETLPHATDAPLAAPLTGPDFRSVQLQTPSQVGTRRLRIFPRSAVRFNVESFESTTTTPAEQIVVLSGGVNVLIDGFDAVLGTVDLSADRIILWTRLSSDTDFATETVQTRDAPLQVYLEGNVVIRQGENVLRASQAFYDAREERALMLNAELKTRIPGFPVPMRLRADTIRQLSTNTFQAQQAWITTSEYGVPGYKLSAGDIFIEPRAEDSWFFPGEVEFDPATGEERIESRPWATTLQNQFDVEGVPLFYFPYLSFPAEDPNIPLRSISFQNDRIFGTQVYTQWNLFQLLGLERPRGYRWDLHLDYLSDRGPEIGSSGRYVGRERFGLEGPYVGNASAMFIWDTGRDNLGADRSVLIPAQEARGRFNLLDRQDLPFGMTLQTELSYLSDRNYLEQYNENTFDAGKDYETAIYLKQQEQNWAWSILGRTQLYDYYNNTQWLPRADFNLLGQPILGDLFTWSTSSYLGYADQQIASGPTDPNDRFSILPYEGNAQGLVSVSRHELSMPFDLGPLHVVPYVLGEAAYWGEDYTGNSLERLGGMAGVRSSLEFWKVFPHVHSDIFNLDGLAHKMVFDADFGWTETDQPLSRVPQFNEIDDNAQEQFRRRLLFNTYGGTLPATVEPRFYGVRAGVGNSVTSPWHELMTDQIALRLGWRHRLQTQVGPANAKRIKDWMTLDLETVFFPRAERDNFGEDFGVYGIRYQWHLSDRTTLQASGHFDTFPDAPRTWNLALLSQRSTRGSVYLGIRNIEGPGLHSEILSASYTYQMSDKWVTTLGTAYDIAERQNRGQSITLTRVGSDFLVHFGTVIDPNKSNFGIGISVEPKFLSLFGNPGTQLSSLLGTGGSRSPSSSRR